MFSSSNQGAGLAAIFAAQTAEAEARYSTAPGVEVYFALVNTWNCFLGRNSVGTQTAEQAGSETRKATGRGGLCRLV